MLGREVACSPQDAKKGSLQRAILQFPYYFEEQEAPFPSQGGKTGIPGASFLQSFLHRDFGNEEGKDSQPWRWALWCSPALCTGKGRVLCPTGLPLVPPQPLPCRHLLNFNSRILLKFSLGPLPWPLKKLQFVSIYHLPEYSKKNLSRVSSHSSPAAQVVHH